MTGPVSAVNTLFSPPPVSRWSQYRAALALGLGGLAWEQKFPDTPVNWLKLSQHPLPLTEADWLLVLQAGESYLHPTRPDHQLPRAQDHANSQLTLPLLLGVLQAIDTPNPASIFSPPHLLDVSGRYVQACHQALNHQLIPPLAWEQWMSRLALENHPLDGPVDLDQYLNRAALWSSLYGLQFGWPGVPILWRVGIPVELDRLVTQVLGAWVGAIGNENRGENWAITAPGQMYPRH